MRSASTALFTILGALAVTVEASAQSRELAPWNFAPPVRSEQAPPARRSADPFKVPLFGDLFQFGYNYQAGFNFANGGFNFGFQGGFQTGLQIGNASVVAAPVAVARGAFKVGENGSPFPQQRLFIAYNYYNDVRGTLNVHREILGYEMTAFSERASVEVRLPLLQNRAHTGEKEDEIGDLTAIGKVAFVRRPSGVFSGGLGITLPTSNVPSAFDLRNNRAREVHSTLLQPFLGYHRAWGDFFVQGLSSALVPTDSRDAAFFFNDIGIGYAVAVSDRGLRAIVPVAELHVNTPLSNRGLPGYADSTNVTAGSFFLLGDVTRLGVAFGRRVRGPRLFSYEALASVNWVF